METERHQEEETKREHRESAMYTVKAQIRLKRERERAKQLNSEVVLQKKRKY